MASLSRVFFFFFLIFCSMMLSGAAGLVVGGGRVGVNYGVNADNLPPPDQVVGILQSHGIGKVKLFNADRRIIGAFNDTGIELALGIPNKMVVDMATMHRHHNPATAWIREYITPFIHRARITSILVGNEVYSTGDPILMDSLLPAMKAVHCSLTTLGLADKVSVSTAHSLSVMANGDPPSAGAFRKDLAHLMHPLLDFISTATTNSSFLINPYPFYNTVPSNSISNNDTTQILSYKLFQPNPGFVDPATNLHYDNMLYAQIDSVYAALKAMGYDDIKVELGETGWPSMGVEPEATLHNAAAYNRNLIQRIRMKQGTPMRPDIPVQAYIYALFNENLRPGTTSNRNFGLFHADGTLVYDIHAVPSKDHLRLPSSSSSSPPSTTTTCVWTALALAAALLLFL